MRAIGEGVRMLDRSREFLVLAECLNFVKAAERLHMSQPSLTRHIARLECELGFKLFNRNPMALTPAGAHYFDAVRGVIDQFDAVVEQGRRIAAENGTGPTVSMVVSSNNRSAAVMFEAMATLHDRHPYEPAAHLLPDSHMAVAASVLSGKADVAAFCDTEIAPYASCVDGEENTAGATYAINADASAPFDTVTGKEFVIIQSTPVLNGPFAYNSDALDPVDVKAIQELFTSDEVANNELIFVPADSDGVGMFEKTDQERFVLVDDAWFDPIRDLSK